MNKDEHLAWCKTRALEYVDRGDFPHALASFASDLGKHPETETLAREVAMGWPVDLRGPGVLKAIRRFIETFDVMSTTAEPGSRYWEDVRLTQDELVEECKRRFGENPRYWAFECPNCGDVARAHDFSPYVAPGDGSELPGQQLLGMICIGRKLGALEAKSNDAWGGRGCDWAAGGLFKGPWTILIGSEELGIQECPAFPLANAVTCPDCERTSWNPNDFREGYCGNCHDWTSKPRNGMMTPFTAREMATVSGNCPCPHDAVKHGKGCPWKGTHRSR